MNNLWILIPLILGAWAAVSVAAGLVIGPVLKRCRETAEAAAARELEGRAK